MKNFHHYLKYYMCQSGPNDCGIACLSMILNYTGRSVDGVRLMNNTIVSEQGLSLLELRDVSKEHQLISRCVKMDLEHLNRLAKPCILHLIKKGFGNHFVVCFETVKKRSGYAYIIADPATGMSLMDETELTALWSENAALYFEAVKEVSPSFFQHPWLGLLKIRSFKKALILTMPFLSICSALLGIGISWMLQRGLNDSFAEKKISLLAALLVLVFFITVFKSVVTYIRQSVLITLNSAVGQQLNTAFIDRIAERKGSPVSSGSIRKSISEIQKVQNAIMAFISVLVSDGSMVSFIIAGFWFFEPVAGLMNTTYVTALLVFAFRQSAVSAAQSLKLQELSGAFEKGLAGEHILTFGTNVNHDRTGKHLENYNRYHQCAKMLAVKMSRISFWYEFIGTVNVIIIFIFCIYQNHKEQLSYSSLMVEVILSYFITAMVPKICSVFSVIAEGALLVSRLLES